ncbi:hypothetical protein VNO77_25477 [Canavalia gladiata]|uniref:Glycolipid transfer protein domain-containing protein n=1 Tax=Canavalia gladiata TaxID=3824 RepID=A0AAN9L867_CANGL
MQRKYASERVDAMEHAKHMTDKEIGLINTSPIRLWRCVVGNPEIGGDPKGKEANAARNNSAVYRRRLTIQSLWMAEGNGDKTLRKIADAFKDLATVLSDSHESAVVEVAPFSRACSLVSPLFASLGVAFKFAEMDYVAKVDDLAEASKSIQTLQSLIDLDVQANTVRKAGSHTRNLLRVKRGIDMVRVLFEQIIVMEGNSLKDPASKAYEQVFAPHHGWAIRKAVSAGMYVLPTREQLLKKLNEDEASAKVQMQIYVTASAPLIQYVEKLFVSRNLGIDW